MKLDRSLYPFESNYFPIGEHRLHYLDEGQGEAVVMVHGNPTWSFYYRQLVLELREHYRCVVPDHMGCGLSDKPSDSDYKYTLQSRVDDLECLLDSTVPDGPINLIVHDWGGAIGMAWATRNAHRIKSLVVLNTGAFRNPKGQRIPLSLKLVRDTPLGPLLVRGLNAFSWGATHLAVCEKMSPAVRASYRSPYNSWANRIATLRFVQDIPLSEKDPAYNVVMATENGLENLATTPCLICWGEKDFVFDTPFLDEWIRRFPNADVHRFSDGGHYILEDKSDEVNRLIADFLARVPASST